ncbi:MAG: GatB/YqeY domain-containing protein [Candidatus Pacebacteria bacterium]|nr:GatB/YqeY domain-containing protein [Candidatus Paceibacterota bacterium]
MLHEEIKLGIRGAMKTKDTVKLDVLRGLVTAFTNELVSSGKTPQEVLSDEVVLSIITRTAKQRRESIAQYEAANRKDLAEEDRSQLNILETFLPILMTQEEVTQIVLAKQNALGITDSSKKGTLMAEIMKELKGKADGQLVKKVVDSLFT